MTTQAFAYNGGSGGADDLMVPQDFVVPAGITEILMECWGAKGGSAFGTTNTPGNGGYIKALVTVTPGETLKVYTGGWPNTSGAARINGGDNGGGDGGNWSSDGGGGGGATDVRRSPYALADRLVVAGGGGGSGAYTPGGSGGTGTGGHGGYPAGNDGGGGAPSGKGGTQTAGGASGGGSSTAGTLGTGGVASDGGLGAGGGGGGGGLYGGGASQSDVSANNPGGGGGSSGVGTGATILSTTTGLWDSHGKALFTYTAGSSPLALPTLASDVPFLQANDRFTAVICSDRGTSTTTAEFRHWYAASPLWSESLASDTNIPTFYSLDENGNYTPGHLELPFLATGNNEVLIDSVIVEFYPRPTSIDEDIAESYPIGFNGRVEGFGIPDYERVVSTTTTYSITSGTAVSDDFSYSSTVGAQASDPWPNLRTVELPIRMNQRVRSARVILSDIHLCQIQRVQLLGTRIPSRET